MQRSKRTEARLKQFLRKSVTIGSSLAVSTVGTSMLSQVAMAAEHDTVYVQITSSFQRDYVEGDTLSLKGIMVADEGAGGAGTYTAKSVVDITEAYNKGTVTTFLDGTPVTLDTKLVKATHSGKQIKVVGVKAIVTSTAKDISDADLVITVHKASEPTGITVEDKSSKKYVAGDKFDPSNLVITKKYGTTLSKAVNYSDLSENEKAKVVFTKTDGTQIKAGDVLTEDTVKVTYLGQPCELKLSDYSDTVKSVDSVTAPFDTYSANQVFSPEGLKLKVTYDNGETREVTYSSSDTNFGGWSVKPGDKIPSGTKEISFTYGGKSAKFTVTEGKTTTLKDETTGITVAGVIPDGAKLKITKISESDERYTKFKLEDGSMSVGCYNISLVNDKDEELTLSNALTVTVPSIDDCIKDGSKITVYHWKDSKQETVNGSPFTVKDGKILFTVSSLSPFMFAMPKAQYDEAVAAATANQSDPTKTTATTTANNAAKTGTTTTASKSTAGTTSGTSTASRSSTSKKTGDNATVMGGILGLISAAGAGIAALLKKKRKKHI